MVALAKEGRLYRVRADSCTCRGGKPQCWPPLESTFVWGFGAHRMNAAVTPGWTLIATEILASIVLLLLLLLLAVAAALFVYDRAQTRNAILRNFPVIGHTRKWLQHFGVFFRRYFSAD